MNTTTVSGRTNPAWRRLPTIILANGWFGIGSGLILLVASPWLGDWFDLPAWVIAVVGASLVPYGWMLRSAAEAEPFDRRFGWLATVGDITWVVAAVALIAIPNTMSAAGKWTLGIVTIAVLDFGLLQLRALLGSD